MTIYAAKPRFQAMLRPLVGRLAAMGVTANQVTVAAAVGSLAVALAVGVGVAGGHPDVFLLLPLWMLVRMALNAIDGMLAREHGQASRLGGYLNEIGDVVSDAALYAPFALLPPFRPLEVGMVVVLAMLTEFAGVLGQAGGGARRYDGPMGKSDRALVFGVLGFWAGLAGGLPLWTVWLIPALNALLAVTIFNRVRAGLAASAP